MCSSNLSYLKTHQTILLTLSCTCSVHLLPHLKWQGAQHASGLQLNELYFSHILYQSTYKTAEWTLKMSKDQLFLLCFLSVVGFTKSFLLDFHAFLHTSKSSCLFENPITTSHCRHGQNCNSLKDPTSSSLSFPSAQTSFPPTFLHLCFASAWALARSWTKQAHTASWAVPLIEKILLSLILRDPFG